MLLGRIGDNVAKVRWTFTEHQNGNACWTWTRHLLNGEIEVTSKPFDTYGEVVSNSLNSGFQPGLETWAVKTANGTSIFNRNAPEREPPDVEQAPAAAAVPFSRR
jgi:hypothetical protein